MNIDEILLDINRMWEDCHIPDRSILRTRVLSETTTSLLHTRDTGVIADDFSITTYNKSTSVSLTDTEVKLSSTRTTLNSSSVSLPKEVYFGGYLLNPELYSSELLVPTDQYNFIKDSIPLVIGTPLVAIGQQSVLLSELFETKPFLTEAMKQLSNPILSKYIKRLSEL